MESKFQTSFIPKSSLSDGGIAKNKTPISIFSIIANLLIVVSVLSACLVTVYSKVILLNQVSSKEEEFKKVQDEIKKVSSVDDLTLISKKMESAQNILDNHIGFSPIFGILEENTLKRLKYNSMSVSYLGDNKVALSIRGQAKEYGVVAKQSDTFASSTKDKIIGPIFSDVSLDDKGNVNFNLMALINPSIIKYKP